MLGPALLFVVHGKQFEQLEGGGMNMRGQLGDVVFEAFEIVKMLWVGKVMEGAQRVGMIHGGNLFFAYCLIIQYYLCK